MPCLTVTSQKHSLETVKVHPFKCLENSNEAQAQCAFSNLPEARPSIGEVSDIKKNFFTLYGKENCILLIMWGFQFSAISAKRKKNQLVTKVKRFEWNHMPHCKKNFNWEDKKD